MSVDVDLKKMFQFPALEPARESLSSVPRFSFVFGLYVCCRRLRRPPSSFPSTCSSPPLSLRLAWFFFYRVLPSFFCGAFTDFRPRHCVTRFRDGFAKHPVGSCGISSLAAASPNRRPRAKGQAEGRNRPPVKVAPLPERRVTKMSLFRRLRCGGVVRPDGRSIPAADDPLDVFPTR